MAALSTLNQLDQNGDKVNYFWHENDLGVLTSKGYIWSTALFDRGILVMPEAFDKEPITSTLGATAEDAWNFNPLPAAIRFFELEANRNEDTLEPLIPRDELNSKYSNLDLFFEQDEKQSTVDILVNRKILEKERQSIIARGPEGSFNPFNSGFYTGGAKLATSLAVSIADPINIASAFIPVVGEARFASLVARQGLTKARGIRGVVEGAVGAAVVEEVCQTAQDLLNQYLWFNDAPVVAAGLQDNVATLVLANPGIFVKAPEGKHELEGGLTIYTDAEGFINELETEATEMGDDMEGD